MKRFFCAAFFIAVITLLAACGALNTTTAAAQATATDQFYLPRPKNTVHRQGERDRRQGGGRHGPEQRHTGVHDLRCSRDPGHRGFSRDVSRRRGRAYPDLLRRSFDAAQNLSFERPAGRFLFLFSGASAQL